MHQPRLVFAENLQPHSRSRGPRSETPARSPSYARTMSAGELAYKWVAGNTIAYRMVGTGPPLVLLHGYGRARWEKRLRRSDVRAAIATRHGR